LLERTTATVNRYMAVVSAVLHYAHEKGKLAGVLKIPFMKEPRERFRWLTREQAVALIDELPEHLSCLTRFALATGLRRANVTGLTWDNLDLARKIAWVWPDEAKAAKPIAVPLNDDAMAALRERQGTHAQYVFTYHGKPIHLTTTKAWKKALARAGILAGFTFHGLRHTWASWHVMGGTPLEVLKELGGWADLKMVQRYAPLAPGYVAAYVGNASLGLPTKPPTQEKRDSEASLNPLLLGRCTGLEPVTLGITIRCSTN